MPKHILPHDSYLINLGHPDEEKLQKSRDAFIDEINRGNIAKIFGVHRNTEADGQKNGEKKNEFIKKMDEEEN